MRTLLVTIVAALVAVQAASVDTDAPAQVGEAASDIQSLIRRLSDEKFKVREEAMLRLWEMGDEALPELKAALTGSDPEAAFRARELIRKIQLHITPGTDAGVLALVEQYGKASVSEKTTLLAKMRNKKAWRQMLKLYAAETNPEVREKLRDSVGGVAIRAARERLAAGDHRGAREFLELAPVDNSSLLSLAEFHRSQGTLADELTRARAVKGRKSEAWQLALCRAAGDVKTARELAQTLDEPRIAAAMACLAGDPVPWLRLPPGENEEFATASTAYSSIVAKWWSGQKVRKADYEPLFRALAQRDPTEKNAAMNTLFLLGETQAAEESLAKTIPMAAFAFYDSLERVPEALKAFGLDSEHPDYTPWVKKRVDRLTKDEIEDQRGVSFHDQELVVLASFFERRGLHDEAFSVFSGPLAALAQKDEKVFLELLARFFLKQNSVIAAPRLARRIGAAWAGDDKGRWNDLVTAAFGEEKQNTEWWEWLEELSPKTSRAERFEAMLALYCIGPDPGKLREKWLALAWKSVEAAPIGQKDQLAARIWHLSSEAGDAANAIRAWGLMPDNERTEVFWGINIMHLAAEERWDDVAKVLSKRIATISETKEVPDASLHAYLAASLRLAGREDEAVVHDQWADKLHLADPGVASSIGAGYAFGRDYQRAAIWWARAACEADPENSGFMSALKFHSEQLLEDGAWKEAAATTEVFARLYANYDNPRDSVLLLMHLRLQADTARALANLANDRPGSIALLEKCHHLFECDGSLADLFFPALRRAGLIKQHDEWFQKTWNLMNEVIVRYPECDNTRNTAAWFASRAMRKLDEAEEHLRKALASSPWQPAYLDTMAEIQFARGDRPKAIEWSRKAVNFSPSESQLSRQQARFRLAPLAK